MMSAPITADSSLQGVKSSERLVVTMPALYRPEVLAATLWSFERGLFRQFPTRTLILNVDPLGVDPSLHGEKKDQILMLAHHYFDQVITRFPSQASFPDAVQWLWQQALELEQCFLHLEDDWFLNRSVPVKRILNLLAQPKTASVRLHRQRNLPKAQASNLSLNPVFFNPVFIQETLKNFQLDKDPEKQFMLEPLISSLSDWRHFVVPAWGAQEANSAASDLAVVPADRGGWVSDLGVHWRKSQDLQKISEKGFSYWRTAHANKISLIKNRILLRFKLYFYRKRLQVNSLLRRDCS
jgi:hypothetical protein